SCSGWEGVVPPCYGYQALTCRASRRHGGHSNPGYCMTPGTVRSEHRLDNRTARRRGFHTKTKPHRREPMGFCGIKA
ncbi:hypothetical protein, partial [Nostoc linckia]|uniref:hypothetical protein n=1 Tax=Nostoc linckia TaxID=92942 RepID=UPI001C558631